MCQDSFQNIFLTVYQIESAWFGVSFNVLAEPFKCRQWWLWYSEVGSFLNLHGNSILGLTAFSAARPAMVQADRLLMKALLSRHVNPVCNRRFDFNSPRHAYLSFFTLLSLWKYLRVLLKDLDILGNAPSSLNWFSEDTTTPEYYDFWSCRSRSSPLHTGPPRTAFCRGCFSSKNRTLLKLRCYTGSNFCLSLFAFSLLLFSAFKIPYN